MAVRFILGAVAEQSDGLPLGEVLKQAKGKFLPVVFDHVIPRVDRAVFKKLGLIAAAKGFPADFAGLNLAQELLAWSKIGHPDIITVLWQTAAPQARGEDAQAVFFRLNWRVNGLCQDHAGPDFSNSEGKSKVEVAGLPAGYQAISGCHLPRLRHLPRPRSVSRGAVLFFPYGEPY